MGPYRERLLIRSADILAYTIVAASKGYTYTNLLCDPCKEGECQEIADRIEETCYAAFRDSLFQVCFSFCMCIINILLKNSYSKGSRWFFPAFHEARIKSNE